MGNGNSHPTASGQGLDADAFCVVCSSVNPEGTLICRTCGNNLRDQKAQRVAGHSGAEADMLLEPERKALMPIALAVLGILFVLWTALNLGHIEEWLVGARASDISAQIYWTGPNSGILDEMIVQLDADPLTADEKRAAERGVRDAGQGRPSAGSYDGHYVLLRSGGIPGEYGEALVRQVSDDRVLFVARVNRGRVEVRGEGFFESGNRIASRETAGILLNGRYYTAAGFATFGGDNWYTCYGASDLDDASYSTIAIRVR